MAKKVKGLGDAISVVTKAIGIEECEGCKKRKDYLNVNFAFNKPKPLTDEQKLRVESEPLQVYNEAFNQEVQPEQFTGGVQKAIIKKLNQLLNYEN
jgi:hypothetical protein